MKKIIITAAVCLFSATSLFAQSAESSIPVVTESSQTSVVASAKYGYLSFSQVLENMTEYKLAKQQLKDLRAKYEAEAQYNEARFKRQFAEYLQGQKEFPQSIMLKRQRDLQEALEKNLAFRDEAERLLKKAEEETLAPIKTRLSNAIKAVGGTYKLDYIYNLDTNAMPYVNPALVMDVTKLVEQQLQATQQ